MDSVYIQSLLCKSTRRRKRSPSNSPACTRLRRTCMANPPSRTLWRTRANSRPDFPCSKIRFKEDYKMLKRHWERWPLFVFPAGFRKQCDWTVFCGFFSRWFVFPLPLPPYTVRRPSARRAHEWSCVALRTNSLPHPDLLFAKSLGASLQPVATQICHLGGTPQLKGQETAYSYINDNQNAERPTTLPKSERKSWRCATTSSIPTCHFGGKSPAERPGDRLQLHQWQWQCRAPDDGDGGGGAARGITLQMRPTAGSGRDEATGEAGKQNDEARCQQRMYVPNPPARKEFAGEPAIKRELNDWSVLQARDAIVFRRLWKPQSRSENGRHRCGTLRRKKEISQGAVYVL